MPYHIDEENSELVFEVHDGDRLIIKLKAATGGGGSDIYLIKTGDLSTPTDNNTFSAQRILEEIQKANQGSSFWVMKEDSSGNKYISTIYDVVSEKGINAYASFNPNVPSIFDGLPLDNVTIHKNTDTGLIEVIGGTGGASNWDELQGKPSWIGATKPTYNWSEILSKPTTLSGYGITDGVTISTEQSITGQKTFSKTIYQGSNLANRRALSYVDTSNNIIYSDVNGESIIRGSIIRLQNANGTDCAYISGSQLYANKNIIVNSGYITIKDGWFQNSAVGQGIMNVAGDARLYYEPTFGGWKSDKPFVAERLVKISNQNGIAEIELNSVISETGKTAKITLDNSGLNLIASNDNNGSTLIIKSYVLDALSIKTNNFTYKVWHSGNDGASSGLDADLLDGKHYTDIINGNVESATKLQTARTIWGQSFDGTANVNGTLTGVSGITFSNASAFNIDEYGNFKAKENSDSAYWHIDRYDGTVSICVRSQSGNVGIGTDSPSTKLHIAGDILSTGGVTCYSSDSRAKTILEELNLSLKDIAESPTIRFKWNNWKINDDGKTHIGGIAQYVQKILPETILEADGILNLDYSTTAYIYAVQTARHLSTYETRTDRKIKKLKKEIKILKRKLKQPGYEETDTLVN